MLLHIYGTILLCGDDSGGLTDGEHIQLVSVRDDVADIVYSLSMEINELTSQLYIFLVPASY